MSFRCDGCQKAFPNDTSTQRAPTEVVVKARARHYYADRDQNPGVGWEAARSAKLCNGCLAEHQPPTVDLSNPEDLPDVDPT